MNLDSGRAAMLRPTGATPWPSPYWQRPANPPPPRQRASRGHLTTAPRAIGESTDGAPSSRRGRHPELLQLASSGSARTLANDGSDSSDRGSSGATGAQASGAAVRLEQPPRPEDVDERYRRADYSDVFQFESRQAFAQCIAGGEPRMRLVEAALHVTAEDDAIASHSTVRFPVWAWRERIERLIDQLCRKDLRRAGAAAAAADHAGREGAADGGVGPQAAAILRVAEQYLFEEVGFRMPEYGRSNLPANSLVDHAGVWEDARLGYLHETLIRRLGHPAVLGLLLGEVTSQLLARGVLPCAAAIDTRSYMTLPRAVPLPGLTREVLMLGSSNSSSSGMASLNTCTSEVLVETLRHLKRSYWPFPWDTAVDMSYPWAVGSHGGFRSAAKAAMGDDMSAALAAIGKVAAWRLERGIWTSPGAGDLRRARAACERLVLLAGEQYPEERRDLAVLLLHSGDLPAARLELMTYLNLIAVSDKPGSAATATALNPALTYPTAISSSSSSSSPSVTAVAAVRSPSQGSGTDPRVTNAAARSSPADHLLPGPGQVHSRDPFDLLLCRQLMAALEGRAAQPSSSSPSLSSSHLNGLGQVAKEGEEEDEEGEGGLQEPLSIESVLRAVPPWEVERDGGGSGSGGRRRYLPLTW